MKILLQVLAVVFCLSGCATPAPQSLSDKIIGEWKATNQAEPYSVIFKPDGKMTHKSKFVDIKGQWKVIDEGHIKQWAGEGFMGNLSTEQTVRPTAITFTDNNHMTTEVDGNVFVFERTK